MSFGFDVIEVQRAVVVESARAQGLYSWPSVLGAMEVRRPNPITKGRSKALEYFADHTVLKCLWEIKSNVANNA